MKVSAIRSGVSFGAAISSNEIEEFKRVRDEAKSLVGQTGKSIFIVHDACLPQSAMRNTGAANLASRESLDFLKYMQTYTGCNMVEVLPQGQYGNAVGSGLYCPYTGTAFSLGNNQISPALLTTERYGKLLTSEEFKRIVDANNLQDSGEIVNYENVMSHDGEQNKVLKIAHERFKELDEASDLKQRYKTYIAENDEWLSIPNSNESDTEFYKFKQFLADSHLKDAKTEINNLGMKLCGDCLINFSEDERKAFPKAFLENGFIGNSDWKIAALDYDKLSDPTSDAAKLLKMKVQLFAKRYDAIRFDVGWAYLNPLVANSEGVTHGKYLGNDVLKYIEDAVKEVKGEDFDLKNLMYEFEGGREFVENSSELLDAAKNRVKIYGSTHMHDNEFDIWGSNHAFLKRGWDPDYFVIGPGNHDPQPLRQIAYNMIDLPVTTGPKYHKDEAVDALSKIFNKQAESLKDPVEFAKSKWAEPMTARNNQMFYMDVFGREERFNMQDLNTVNDEARGLHARKNFAYKIPSNYEYAYHNSVAEGFGFNIMDSLERVFKLKGFDKTHSDLYQKIIKFRDILLKPVKISGLEILLSSSIIETMESKKQKYTTLFDDTVEEDLLRKSVDNIMPKEQRIDVKPPKGKGIVVFAGLLVGGATVYCINKFKKMKTKKMVAQNPVLQQIQRPVAPKQKMINQPSMKEFLA